MSTMGATTIELDATEMKSPPKKTLEMGFGFYVAGLHILDTKSELVPNNKSCTYDFTVIGSSSGLID